MISDNNVRKVLIALLVMATLLSLSIVFQLVWLGLELKYGPLFPDWFYYLISLEL